MNSRIASDGSSNGPAFYSQSARRLLMHEVKGGQGLSLLRQGLSTKENAGPPGNSLHKKTGDSFAANERKSTCSEAISARSAQRGGPEAASPDAVIERRPGPHQFFSNTATNASPGNPRSRSPGATNRALLSTVGLMPGGAGVDSAAAWNPPAESAWPAPAKRCQNTPSPPESRKKLRFPCPDSPKTSTVLGSRFRDGPDSLRDRATPGPRHPGAGTWDAP